MINSDLFKPLFLDKISNNNNNNDKINSKKFSYSDISVQTDPNWIEEIKKELSSTIKAELSVKNKSSKSTKSKQDTVRSQISRSSSFKTRRKTKQVLEEYTDRQSNISSASSESLPVYPEKKVDDEFGINIFDVSDEEDVEIDLEKLNSISKDYQNPTKIGTSQEEIDKAIQRNIIYDAGLPTILKISKELEFTNVDPPLSTDFLLNNTISDSDEICEFCKKSLIPVPSIQEQVESDVDQAKLFCCQEFRDLVDLALVHKNDGSSLIHIKQVQPKLIDVSPNQNHKTPEDLVEDQSKSERIREKILERQKQASLSNPAEKLKIDGPRRAYTEFPAVQSVLDDNLSISKHSMDSVMTRQMKVINYQLSSFKFIEDGWTICLPNMNADDLIHKEEMGTFMINMDYNNLIQNIFGKIVLSNQCALTGVVRQNYSNGTTFLVLFSNGSANIYYPSGNLAISLVRETIDSPMICIIHEEFPLNEGKFKILGMASTNGFGSFSLDTGEIKIIYDTYMGIEMERNGSKKRQWNWDGKPHIHAPPFQPLFFSLNRYIGVRISSRNKIFINFFSISRQIHINVGFNYQLPEKVQQQMQSMMKTELLKIRNPLNDLRNKIRTYINKCHDALGHPNLLYDNKWPLKQNKLSKLAIERKSQLSLSML